MSGIYIKGMEMPVTCCHCAFMYFDPDAANSNNGNPGSYLCSFTKEEIWNTQRDPNCPLIPVPDHGRLIDADEAISHLFNGEQCLYCWDEIEDAVDATVTIITADKEGEA